jgi:hypothetical protein
MAPLRNDKTTNTSNLGPNLFYYAEVLSNNDPSDGGRLTVRVVGIDRHVNRAVNNEHLTAFPLMPKTFVTLPAVGDLVLVFIMNNDNPQQDRFWIGPIISQSHKIDLDRFNGTARALLDGGSVIAPDAAASTIPEAEGVYPQDENLVLLNSRGRSDILLGKDFITLRSGKYPKDNKLQYNKKSIGYFKIQSRVITEDTNQHEETHSVMVSDKILLLTRNGDIGKLKSVDFSDNKTDISDKQIDEIIKDGQSLVYGDKLLDLLGLIRNYAISHVHSYNGNKAVREDSLKQLLEFDMTTLLAKNIKII